MSEPVATTKLTGMSRYAKHGVVKVDDAIVSECTHQHWNQKAAQACAEKLLAAYLKP